MIFVISYIGRKRAPEDKMKMCQTGVPVRWRKVYVKLAYKPRGPSGPFLSTVSVAQTHLSPFWFSKMAECLHVSVKIVLSTLCKGGEDPKGIPIKTGRGYVVRFPLPYLWPNLWFFLPHLWPGQKNWHPIHQYKVSDLPYNYISLVRTNSKLS